MINKRDYPWPGRPLLSHGDLDELVDAVNHSLDNEGGIQRYHNNTVVESSRELPMYMAVMMTQAQLDTHFGEDEEDAGLRQRNHPKLGSEESADDDMYSAWCAVLQLSSKTNARYARLREPVLVYFPQLGLFDDEASFAGCEPVNPNEILPIFYNQSDDRWEAIRPTKQGDQMDVVTVCDASRPVESCDEGTIGSGDTEGQFCCLFDAMAYRVLPDCEDTGNYYCSPDNDTFAIWLYAPDKRALPPEGVSDWGRRVQDAYTVQNWQPWGITGPSLSTTRPVYQVAAVACFCPRDQGTIRLWCSYDLSTEYIDADFELREITIDGEGIPDWDWDTTYNDDDMVWWPEQGEEDAQIYRATQDVPEDMEPGVEPGWDDYWTEVSLDEEQIHEGEFCITHPIPLILTKCECRGLEPACETIPQDDHIVYATFDSITGVPTACYDLGGEPRAWPGGSLTFFEDNFIVSDTDRCVVASELNPALEEEPMSIESCYRIRFYCTGGAIDEFGFLTTVSHIRLYHILPWGHYAETSLGITSEDDPDREIAGPVMASELNSCIGRTMGRFALTSFSTTAPAPGQEPLRFTPQLNDHCLLGCGQILYDHSPLPTWSVTGDYNQGDYVLHANKLWLAVTNPLAGSEPGAVGNTDWEEQTEDVLEWCGCPEPQDPCNCRDVYFQLTFNCSMSDPVE